MLARPPIGHRKPVGVEVPGDQVRTGPCHVRRAHGEPLPDLLQLRGELLLGDGLALLLFAVLVPDRPPPAAFVPGRIHSDPEVKFDYLPVTPRGGPRVEAGNPASSQAG